MTKPLNDIATLRRQASEELTRAATPEALEAWRIKYLGRKGALPLLLRQVKELPVPERKEAGQAGNTARHELEAEYQARWQELRLGAAAAVGEKPPAENKKTGVLHPLTHALRRFQAIFSAIGFTWVEGPLVEDPRYNFDFLNIPPEHPARAETDTFYLTNGLILRTHVSPVQIRGPRELKLKPPFKIVYPGRSFRAERTDATHEHTFIQYEFMVVDKTASLADLKGIIQYVYSEYFETDLKIRFRPGYFPFVEPGLEIDASCLFCEQRGCRICKHTGWLELAGAGAAHPTVLKNISVDPDEFQGLALGGGLDRLVMLKYGIEDVRALRSGDIKLLSRFA